MRRWGLVLLLAGLTAAFAEAGELFVSAAASLTNVMKEVSSGFEKQSGVKVVLNFGASNMLARQIEEGAPADVFLSADETEMDRLEKQIVKETRSDLLTNRLVVVVRADSQLQIGSLSDLTNATFGKIAVADPRAVPAGVYAREALTSAGLWEKVATKIVPTENVRTALAVVEAGNADAGFVYKTDATSSSKVRVAFNLPPETAPKIVYPVAILARSSNRDDAVHYLAFLKSAEAAQIFTRFGFGLVK